MSFCLSRFRRYRVIHVSHPCHVFPNQPSLRQSAFSLDQLGKRLKFKVWKRYARCSARRKPVSKQIQVLMRCESPPHGWHLHREGNLLLDIEPAVLRFLEMHCLARFSTASCVGQSTFASFFSSWRLGLCQIMSVLISDVDFRAQSELGLHDQRSGTTQNALDCPQRLLSSSAGPENRSNRRLRVHRVCCHGLGQFMKIRKPLCCQMEQEICASCAVPVLVSEAIWPP